MESVRLAAKGFSRQKINRMLNIVRIRGYPLNEPWSIKLFSETLPPADLELRPAVFFGIFGQKWLSYVDKYIIFSLYIVVLRIIWGIRGLSPKIHLVDQGYGIYVPLFSGLTTIVTCHDILATRGALGDVTVACTPTAAGKILQRFIAAGLRRAT